MKPARFLAIAVASLAAASTASAQHPAPQDADIPSPLGDIVIDATVFQPGCTVDGNGDPNGTKAPVILHSHGWGGSKSSSGFGSFLDACMGVLSFSQRGHGATGGQRNVHDPEFEGQDMKAIVDYVADLPWVELDGPGDPVLGSIGGSYGGGYQWLLAFTELRDTTTFDEEGNIVELGSTRMNALSPDICWYDLAEALGPEGAVRSVWVTLLYAVAVDTFPTYIHESFALGLATGTFPDGTVPGTTNIREEFRKHGPAGFVDLGLQLDIPVMITQGMPDNLFNLNQAWKNFELALTPEAQEKSVFIGHNGGHVLPNVLPPGFSGGGSTCLPGGTTAARIRFFQAAFSGDDPRAAALDLTNGGLPYNLTTTEGNCVSRPSLDGTFDAPVGPVEVVVSPSMAGVPVHYELAEGPLTIAGVPTISGDLTTVGADVRAFFALSRGTSLVDAQVADVNMMPIRSVVPAVRQPITKELPGVAFEVAEGETLYLTVTPISDMFVGFGSRTPGTMVIEDAVVHVPVVE